MNIPFRMKLKERRDNSPNYSRIKNWNQKKIKTSIKWFDDFIPTKKKLLTKKSELEIGLNVKIKQKQIQNKYERLNIVPVSRIFFQLMRNTAQKPININTSRRVKCISPAAHLNGRLFFILPNFARFSHSLNWFRCSTSPQTWYALCKKKRKDNNIETLNMKRAAYVQFHTNSLFFTIIISRSRNDSIFVFEFRFFFLFVAIGFGYSKKKRIESAYASLFVDLFTLNNIQSTYTKIAKVVKIMIVKEHRTELTWWLFSMSHCWAHNACPHWWIRFFFMTIGFFAQRWENMIDSILKIFD